MNFGQEVIPKNSATATSSCRYAGVREGITFTARPIARQLQAMVGAGQTPQPVCDSFPTMQKDRARWMELAELAANEQDPKKLLALISEINQLLDRKQHRLDDIATCSPPSEPK